MIIYFFKWKTQRNTSVKSCPNCRATIEKDDGCNHMTCRCGYHWCWLCVAIIDPNNLTQHFSEHHPMI